MVVSCTDAVPLYANALRQAAGLSQAQIGVVFSAGDFGLFFGAVNGYIYDKTGPRISSITLMFTLACTCLRLLLGLGAARVCCIPCHVAVLLWWLVVWLCVWLAVCARRVYFMCIACLIPMASYCLQWGMERCYSC